MKETTFPVRTSAREQIRIVTDEVNHALSALTREALRALVPNVRFEHGEGNSGAHFLSMLIGTSLSWPYRNGKLVLGTWQGVYFVELDGPRTREVTVYIPSS